MKEMTFTFLTTRGGGKAGGRRERLPVMFLLQAEREERRAHVVLAVQPGFGLWGALCGPRGEPLTCHPSAPSEKDVNDSNSLKGSNAQSFGPVQILAPRLTPLWLPPQPHHLLLSPPTSFLLLLPLLNDFFKDPAQTYGLLFNLSPILPQSVDINSIL